MKTIIKNIILAATSAAVLSACNKKLDIIPEGSPTTGNFWTTDKDAISGANAMTPTTYQKIIKEEKLQDSGL